MTRYEALRASDADRDAVIDRLRKAAGEGRLEPEELEQRVGYALRARTYGELERLLADLPGSPGAAGAGHQAAGSVRGRRGGSTGRCNRGTGGGGRGRVRHGGVVGRAGRAVADPLLLARLSGSAPAPRDAGAAPSADRAALAAHPSLGRGGSGLGAGLPGAAVSARACGRRSARARPGRALSSFPPYRRKTRYSPLPPRGVRRPGPAVAAAARAPAPARWPPVAPSTRGRRATW